MGFDYGRLVSFICALCCIAGIASVVNVAFAANNFEYVNGRWVKVSVNSKSIQQARLSATYYHSFPNVPAPIRNTLPTNKALTVTYSGSRITQLARTARDRTPVYMAVAGAVAGAGWVIDELTGQITQTDYAPDPSLATEGYTPGFNWHCNAGGQFATPVAACNAAHSSWGYTHSVHSGTAPNSVRLNQYYTNGNFRGTVWASPIQCTTGCIQPDLIEQQVPVTQQQQDQKIIPAVLNLPNHQIEESLRDAHGNPRPTPELMDALRDWLSDVAGRDPNLNYDPNTNRLTYTDPNTGTQTDYEPSTPTDVVTDPTESYEPAPVSDWPDFCAWATIVCELVEYIRADPDIPEPEELPFEEINLADVQQDFNSGLGSGSCPAPHTVTIQGKPFVYTFETACYAAETFFKPVLLTLAAFTAGFIIIGASRRAV